jgi:hypothetical protein
VAALRDISGKLNETNQFQPSTFEERGISVPFTTPLLAHSRVRKNYRDMLELCVPQFSGVEGQYVIPWSAVCEMTEPTLHDRLLFEYVEEHDVRTPHQMRMATLSVASSGFGGPEVAEAAAKAIAVDEEAKAVNHVALILRVLQETGKSAVMDLHEVASTDRQEHVRAALFRVASDLGIPPEVLDKRISELALMTYAVGTPWSPVRGRLRALLHDLEQFRDALRKWGTAQVHEAGEKAVFSAEVAEFTLSNCAGPMKGLNALLKTPFGVVVAWEKIKAEPERLTHRLSWMLDGWDMIVEGWGICANDGERIVAAEQMVPVLPLIPRKELEAAQTEQVNGMIKKSRRWVRLNQNWATGELDLDMIHRIEAVKARAL